MDKVSRYREIRNETMKLLDKIKIDDARAKSFANVFKYNKATKDQGAMQYALYFLSINDEMCEIDKYMEMIDKEHPDYELLAKMKQGITSYFKVLECHKGYVAVLDMNSNIKYDVYDIGFSSMGDIIVDLVVYSTMLEIDGIHFFAGYEVALLDYKAGNYKEEIERHKKRIKLTTNPELIELIATLQLSKNGAIYV